MLSARSAGGVFSYVRITSATIRPMSATLSRSIWRRTSQLSLTAITRLITSPGTSRPGSHNQISKGFSSSLSDAFIR